MDVEIVAKVPGFVAARYGPVAISVWDSPPNEDHARSAVSALGLVSRHEDKMLVLAIVGRDTPPPDSAVRDLVAKEMARIARNVVGMAQVIEGVGFRAATMRAVLTGMGIVLRPSYPQKVCVTVDEAAEFLASHSTMRITAPGLAAVVQQLRS